MEGVFWAGSWGTVALSEVEAFNGLINVSGLQNGDGVREAINLPTNYVSDRAKVFDRVLGLESGEGLGE